MTEQNKPKPAEKAEPTVTCEVLRGYWPTDKQEDRIRKGAIVDVPMSQALDGIEAGMLKRLKS